MIGDDVPKKVRNLEYKKIKETSGTRFFYTYLRNVKRLHQIINLNKTMKTIDTYED